MIVLLNYLIHKV